MLLGISRISLCWILAFHPCVSVPFLQKFVVTSSQKEGWTKPIGPRNPKTRQRGVWAWSGLSIPSRDEAPLHTFHENIEDTGDLHLHWGRDEKKRWEKIKRWRDVRWCSVLRKRLALKGRRRCKQTRVEHAGHFIALACVYIRTGEQRSRLLLPVPTSRCVSTAVIVQTSGFPQGTQDLGTMLVEQHWTVWKIRHISWILLVKTVQALPQNSFSAPKLASVVKLLVTKETSSLFFFL